MRNQKGFTLIELIIVIVVLGILAVTAAPQFIDFSTDARTSTVESLRGSVKGASQSIYAKALLEGEESEASATLNSPAVDVVYGYPAATADGIVAALDIDSADWTSQVIASGDATASELAENDMFIYPTGITVDFTDQTTFDATGCGVIYREAATEGAKPSIVAFTTGC